MKPGEFYFKITTRTPFLMHNKSKSLGNLKVKASEPFFDQLDSNSSAINAAQNILQKWGLDDQQDISNNPPMLKRRIFRGCDSDKQIKTEPDEVPKRFRRTFKKQSDILDHLFTADSVEENKQEQRSDTSVNMIDEVRQIKSFNQITLPPMSKKVRFNTEVLIKDIDGSILTKQLQLPQMNRIRRSYQQQPRIQP